VALKNTKLGPGTSVLGNFMGKIENLDVNISAAKGYWVKILVSGNAEYRRKLIALSSKTGLS